MRLSLNALRGPDFDCFLPYVPVRRYGIQANINLKLPKKVLPEVLHHR